MSCAQPGNKTLRVTWRAGQGAATAPLCITPRAPCAMLKESGKPSLLSPFLASALLHLRRFPSILPASLALLWGEPQTPLMGTQRNCRGNCQSSGAIPCSCSHPAAHQLKQGKQMLKGLNKWDLSLLACKDLPGLRGNTCVHCPSPGQPGTTEKETKKTTVRTTTHTFVPPVVCKPFIS